MSATLSGSTSTARRPTCSTRRGKSSGNLRADSEDTAMAAPLVMLHLGLGFFHRAHQAAYVHRLIEAGDASWVIAGGNTRPDMVQLMADLAAQGGAYTLETVTPGGERSYTRITAIKTVVPYHPSLTGLIAIGADASTRIISF